MQVTIELTGTTPLLQHNIRLADPDDEFTKAIAVITGKRKRTEEDRREIDRLEWYGGIYANEQGPLVPSRWVRKCVIEAAKIRRLGKAVTRALVLHALELPLIYDGPRELDALWLLPRFQHAEMVGIQAKRTRRMRPQFPEWSVRAEGTLLTDALDFDQLVELVTMAGLVEGLGDNRINGYGRFDAVVKQA